MPRYKPRLAVIAAIGLASLNACSVESSGSSEVSPRDPVAIDTPIGA